MLQVSDLLCEIFFFSLATFKIVYLFIALYIKKERENKDAYETSLYITWSITAPRNLLFAVGN